MKLLIDGRGGMAGDMFAAALISAGADEKEMIAAMLLAAEKIGTADISTSLTHDSATRLHMTMSHNDGHLAATKARILLSEIIAELNIQPIYASLGSDILEVLIKAENQAHKENTFLTDHHHHEHSHSDDGHHHHHEEAWLHEAQDILIDITGAIYGLQLINAPTTAELISPISLGGGRIKFSHGEMGVPAPATKIILSKYNIAHAMGPIETELCTPTGASILAALKVDVVKEQAIDSPIRKGNSRGGKDLDIVPLTIYLS